LFRNIAVVEWTKGSGISLNILDSFIELGYSAILYVPGEPIPEGTGLVFSYGPYGNIFNITKNIADIPPKQAPKLVHWDTEGMPNFKLPKIIVTVLGAVRSWTGRLSTSQNGWAYLVSKVPIIKYVNNQAYRYRYFGDYHYAYRHNLLNYFFEYSIIYTKAHCRFGLPARYMPWGTAMRDWESLNLERDIDVLWFGKDRSKTRTDRVNQIKQQLGRYKYNMLIVDGISNPYIFGRERIEILNRSKISINLIPAWDFNNFPFRYHLAAPNRSMVISEPFLTHNPEYKIGYHYIESPIDQFVETIVYYLEHKASREEVVQNAFDFSTNEMTLTRSINQILHEIQ